MRFIRVLPIPGPQGVGRVYAENTTIVVPQNPLTVFLNGVRNLTGGYYPDVVAHGPI
jgi:hypothetical protein